MSILLKSINQFIETELIFNNNEIKQSSKFILNFEKININIC